MTPAAAAHATVNCDRDSLNDGKGNDAVATPAPAVQDLLLKQGLGEMM